MSRLSESTMRAFVAAHALSFESEGRYEVMLLDEETDRSTSFRTPGFVGPGRVDLEDACAFGGFDGVVVRRRRGRFGAAEAARCLREIVDDLTYHHPYQFWLLAADREHLGAKLHADFDGLARRASRERLREVLALCGVAPRAARAVPLDALLRELHRARIETLRLQLAARSAAVRPADSGRGRRTGRPPRRRSASTGRRRGSR